MVAWLSTQVKQFGQDMKRTRTNNSVTEESRCQITTGFPASPCVCYPWLLILKCEEKFVEKQKGWVILVDILVLSVVLLFYLLLLLLFVCLFVGWFTIVCLFGCLFICCLFGCLLFVWFAAFCCFMMLLFWTRCVCSEFRIYRGFSFVTMNPWLEFSFYKVKTLLNFLLK